MTKQPQSVTAELTIEISKMTTVMSVIESLIAELPDSQQQKALVRLCKEGNLAGDRAFNHVARICELASQI